MLPWRDRVELYCLDGNGWIYGGLYKAGNFGTFGGFADEGQDPGHAAIYEFEEGCAVHAHDAARIPILPHQRPFTPNEELLADCQQFCGLRTTAFLGRLGEPIKGKTGTQSVNRRNVALYRISDAIRDCCPVGLDPVRAVHNEYRIRVLTMIREYLMNGRKWAPRENEVLAT
jgi:hypothetical protein